MALIAILALASPLAAQTTNFFDGGAGAANSSWANATNWAGDVLPTFDTNAVLVFDYDFGGGTNILFTGNSYTNRSLVFGSNLTGGTNFFQIRTKSQIGGGSASLGRILTLNGGAANASIVIENISDSSLTRLDLGSGAGASEGSVAFATSVDLTNNSGSALFLFNNAVTGSGALNKYGIGTAALNRANTFSGGVNIYEGTVELFGNATAAGTGTVTLGAGNSSDNAVLALGGSGATVVTNTSAVTVGAGSGTRTIANSTNFSTANVALSNTLTLNKDVTFDITQYTANTHDRITVFSTVTGTGGIVKTGTGLLILSNSANSFGGTTTVSEGGLFINGNQSAATGALTVASGATLGGSGTIGGATTINGRHSPGNSPGIQTFNNGLTYNTGASFVWELTANTVTGRGTVFDGVNVAGGALSINSGVTSDLVFNSAGSSVNWSDDFWGSNRQWFVFDNASAPVLSSANVFETLNVGADSFSQSLTSVRVGAGFSWEQIDNGVYLNYTIPEPSTYALLALAAAGLGAHVVRRRRSAR